MNCVKLVLALLLGLSVSVADTSSAQTFSTLYSFSALQNNTNADGAVPLGALTCSGSTLYGTALVGGAAGNGTVFAIQLDGTGFTNLHSFAENGSGDGVSPRAPLILAEGQLYGTTAGGGATSNGTVFVIGTNGAGFSILHSFNRYFSRPGEPLEGAAPSCKLAVGSNTLYGTTKGGGDTGSGTIFALTTNGTTFKTLFAFTAGTDGATPNDVISVGGMLYGTCPWGSWGGTVFAIDIQGISLSSLHIFSNLFQYISGGLAPNTGLVLSSNVLYGTTLSGGDVGPYDSGWGTVFALGLDGINFVTLHTFAPPTFQMNPPDPTQPIQATNSEGARPMAGLLLAGSKLYATTDTGGVFGNGAVFALNTDGTGFTNLHSFGALTMNTNSDGAHPQSALLLVGDTLYGTTTEGGASGQGTLFSISLGPSAPRLKIASAGNNIILSWPADSQGFNLYSTTNLDPTAPWAPVIESAVIIAGRNTVTNPVSTTQQFFRKRHA